MLNLFTLNPLEVREYNFYRNVFIISIKLVVVSDDDTIENMFYL